MTDAELSISDATLIARLRDLGDHASFEPHMHHTAADRIEELAERNKELALQLLAIQGQASDALDMQPTASPELLATTYDVAALVEALDRTTSQGQRYEYSRVGHHLNEASWHVHLAGFKSRDDAEAFLAAALARVKSKEGFSDEKGVM